MAVTALGTASLAWLHAAPLLPFHSAGAWFCFHVACGSRFRNHVAKGCPGEGSAQLSSTGPIYYWQLQRLR